MCFWELQFAYKNLLWDKIQQIPKHSASEEIQLTVHQEENQFGYINL